MFRSDRIKYHTLLLFYVVKVLPIQTKLLAFPDQSSVVLQVKCKGANPAFVVQRGAGAGAGPPPQQKSHVRSAETAYWFSPGREVIF